MKYYCEKPNGVRENDTQDLKVTMKVDRKNFTWQKYYVSVIHNETNENAIKAHYKE